MRPTFGHVEVRFEWKDNDHDLTNLKNDIRKVVGFSTPVIIDDQPMSLDYYPDASLAANPTMINPEKLRHALNSIGQRYGFIIAEVIKASHPTTEQSI